MSELGPEAREILRNGRDGDDPSSADRIRIRAALMAAIAAGSVQALSESANAAVTNTAENMSAASSVGAAKPIIGSLLGGAIVKGIILAIVAGAAIGATALWPRSVLQANSGIHIITQKYAKIDTQKDLPAKDQLPTEIEVPAIVISVSALPHAPPPSQTPEPQIQEENADSLIVEAERLREVRGALQSGDPAKALSLLSEQSAEAEGQKLREERAAARILALCKLGRVEEANAQAAAFLQNNPRSPLAERVRNACPTTP